MCECVFRLEVVLSVSFYDCFISEHQTLVRTAYSECARVRHTFMIMY
jgi:hypothetical protein